MMANTNKPNGFRPVRHLNGSPYNGQTKRCYIPASDTADMFVGDAVVSGGSADADGVATVARASAGGNVRGVIIGFEVESGYLEALYRAGSTARYCYVVESPDVVFEVQEDSVGGAVAVTAVGNNADIALGTDDTVSGASSMMLDSSDVKTGTAQCRIHGLVQRTDNEVGEYARWEVTFNEHELTSTTGA